MEKGHKQKQEQEQEEVQVQLQFLDNGVHRLLIALERLEVFLSIKEGTKIEKYTAMKTHRDKHDDTTIIPTETSYYKEIYLQILSLSIQGHFPKFPKLADSSMKYFLNDILEWYSLRENFIANDIERFAIPILASLTDKTLKPIELSELIYKYVRNLDSDLHHSTKEEKQKVIQEGMIAYIKATNYVEEELRKFEEGNIQVTLTSHARGKAENGYKHLLRSFAILYPEDSIPILLLEKIIKNLHPDILKKEINKVEKAKEIEKEIEKEPEDNEEDIKEIEDKYREINDKSKEIEEESKYIEEESKETRGFKEK
ncbi:hypothetical protein SAMN05444420_11036 [Capnocytophaga granulosa]|uniref:Uncharacterized protein n=1 Tax=Capnocytophaga granulosa TaxID=45242 RepID=A0A1H2ZG98_9FLAO|nr:hypothetical protein [Capnocytophaga granulosa]EPD27195.1 hypothetical protein HMPREF9331_02390 [Capnocytophaga granulosa ATCC 51502]SDX16512.1 hypothetical protein SAMN05444420_11036 [Capnocytophaga granulosa]SUX18817.1 Uncharacterised protein [Capnocytophaga granulosa]